MTRGKQIIEEAKRIIAEAHERGNNDPMVDLAITLSFSLGARWADKHPNWISVEDELPKNKELVFITDGEYTDTGFYEYTFDEWQPCEKWLGDITHWMPLPQAPKKGE